MANGIMTGFSSYAGKRIANSAKLAEVRDRVKKYFEGWGGSSRVTVNGIDDFAKLSKAQKLKYLQGAWKSYYPRIFFERRLFEDMMGRYRYLKSAGWGHTDDIAHNFKAIDFYKDFTKTGNHIFAGNAVSMKTTTTTNVDNWLASTPVKNNLDNLANNLGGTKGITWNETTIFYNSAEVHIYMPRKNVTQQLKAEWLKKLTTKRPKITFKISALEDFVN